MGRLAVMSVLGANVEIGDITYSTGAERGPGEPFVVGQDFAEDGKIWIDFVDPNFERILVELRVTFGKDDTWSGTLSTPDRSVDIECTEG